MHYGKHCATSYFVLLLPFILPSFNVDILLVSKDSNQNMEANLILSASPWADTHEGISSAL